MNNYFSHKNKLFLMEFHVFPCFSCLKMIIQQTSTSFKMTGFSKPQFPNLLILYLTLQNMTVSIVLGQRI